YGLMTVTVVMEYQEGKTAGINPTGWSTVLKTPANNDGTVTLTYSASVSTSDAFPNIFSTGPDSSLYMGFMRGGDWNVNSDCGGWFVQNSLPAVGIPRDYSSNLACSLTTCAQPPEQSSGCVLRFARPQSAVVHYTPGATGTYSPSNPP